MEEKIEITSFRYVDRNDRNLPPYMRIKFSAQTAGAIAATGETVTGALSVDMQPASDYAEMERTAFRDLARYLRQLAEMAENQSGK